MMTPDLAMDDFAQDRIAPPRSAFPQPDRTGFVTSISRKGFHRLAYTEWGDAESRRVVVCVHGLSRQGRDFDCLAAALAAQGYRVLCPDLVGRGRSDWLADPDEYTLPQYAMDLTALIARTGAETIDWIGTSLGGLIGMVLAGQAQTPIRRLVINDIGPFLPWTALKRLADTFRDAPASFDNFDAAIGFHQAALAPFGKLSPSEWRHLTEHSVAPLADGRYTRLCDPKITAAFRSSLFMNLSLWSYWDTITCPTLVLRGAESDLLLPSTLAEMERRGPPTMAVEFPNCGHAPALLDPAQIQTVTEWLRKTL